MILNRNFSEFIGLLEKHAVRYVIVGGYAVGVHGFPRYTGDIDFYIAVSDENAELLLKVFAEFGFSGLGLSKQDFLEPESVIEIGREPQKIQILTDIDGVQFEECYANRLTVSVGSLKIPFIGLEDLIRNKSASPRAKDRIDLEELVRIRREHG
jgi:predicted nucleotidyltransferase